MFGPKCYNATPKKKAKCNLEQHSAGYSTLSKNSDKVFKKLCQA